MQFEDTQHPRLINIPGKLVRRLRRLRLCDLCAYQPTSIEDMRVHAVQTHGFLREGAQVFKRVFCYCGKPGLYRAGTQAFCRAHIEDAVKGTAIVGKKTKARSAAIDENLTTRAKMEARVASHHSAKGRKHKPKGKVAL